MSEIPDIVKQLREAEKLGKLESSSQGSHEELEIPKDLLEDMSDENVEGFKENVENREFNIEQMQHSSSSGDSSVDEKELLFQSTSDLMVYIDKHGKIAKINRAGIAFSGFSEDEVIGQSFWKMPGVFSKHNIPKYLKVFKNTLKGKPTESFLCELHEKSGKKHVMDFSTYPIKENNKVTSILVVAKDVTEQKETEDKCRLITENTDDLIAVAKFSLNPKYTYISPSHEKIMGYKPEELLGKPCLFFVHPDDKKKLISLLGKYVSVKGKKLFTGKDSDVNSIIEYRAKDKSGNWHYLESTVNIMGNELLFVSKDITERKKVQEEISKLSKFPSENKNPVLRVGSDNTIIYANLASKPLLNIWGSEVGNPLPETLQSVTNDAINSKSTKEIEVPCGDITYLLTITSVKDEDYVNVYGLDITKRKKAESEIKYLKEYNENILESNPNSIMVIKGNQIEYVNNSFISTFGKTKDDYISKELKEVMPLEIIPVFEELLREYDKIKELEIKGKSFSVGSFVVKKAEEEEEEERRGIILQDITERRQAEEKTKQQNKINILRAEIWELAAQPLSEDELIQQLVDKIGPFFNLEHASFLRIYPEKKKAIVDIQWRKKDSKSGIGEEFPLWLLKRYFGKPYKVISLRNMPSAAKPIVAPIFKKFGVKSTLLIPYGDIDNPQGYIATSDRKADKEWSKDEIDIFSEMMGIILLKSEEIKAEKEIKEKNEKLKDAHEMLQVMNSGLERKVKERTETIERLLQQKDEFINQLGHDLKTPLTPLVALTPLLRKHLDGKPEIMQVVDTLVTSANHMKNMVDKTLQLASLNSSQIEFEFEQTNLFTEIKNAIENNQFLFNENNIDVLNMVDEEIIVTADKRQLYEVFTNLFTNAIKYSQENKGSIVIDAEKGKDDEVIISVKDDGIGMTSEQQKFVFDEFYKLDSSRHDLDSSGLGLAICRRIVEHHGGRIWVESPGPGKGCAFYFTLNAWREKIMDKKILLVDDDPDICLTMKIFFDDAGFDLQVVKNGSECLEELEKGFHGVVLMDVMMPGMNGWDVVREMVDKGYMDGNVVAMFSVAAPSEEDMDGLRDYVAGFISKPFDTEELIEIVNGYFDKLQKS